MSGAHDARVLHDRGRLGSSRVGAWVDRMWRGANQRLAVSGDVTIGISLRLGLGASIWSAHGLVIGDYCAIGRGSQISVDGMIGNFLMTGPQVKIVGRSDHALDEVGVPVLLSKWVGDRARHPADAVQIGDDVWIGTGAIVLGGVAVGTGAVIGAGAVVTSDVDEFEVVVGNPARVVRRRFTDEQALEHLQRMGQLHSSLTRDR